MAVRYDLTNKFDEYMQALLNLANAKNGLLWDKAMGIIHHYEDPALLSELSNGNMDIIKDAQFQEDLSFQLKLKFNALVINNKLGKMDFDAWIVFKQQLDIFIEANKDHYFYELVLIQQSLNKHK